MTPSPLPPVPASSETQAAVQAALDANHLYLLEIGFYISGVMTALRFLWFLLAIGFMSVMGVIVSHIPQQNHNGQPPPAFVFFIMAGVFGFFVLLMLIFAVLEIFAGRCLKQRRNPLFIQIVAAIYCLSIPWGTALGVFTFMVMNRPTVKALFGRS